MKKFSVDLFCLLGAEAQVLLSCGILLNVVGCCGMLLNVVECWGRLLDVEGCCRMLLDVMGCCWMLGDVVTCCWVLLYGMSNKKLIILHNGYSFSLVVWNYCARNYVNDMVIKIMYLVNCLTEKITAESLNKSFYQKLHLGSKQLLCSLKISTDVVTDSW